ncbi:hypothetical protein [Novilysobacter spongiicola]|uniref:Uncharacterized protein n=1 Tax=Lysobacter spongiicola DSM 21749 TaxID=1122188 RepID=A0A1T4RFD2_9GAMM|nr:hypothetical protein [Lysobacter spongiicola]SKA14587.1 hypothetical protein SAMN02745674_02147 [Lysobacter spongiicola DSM 21749]
MELHASMRRTLSQALLVAVVVGVVACSQSTRPSPPVEHGISGEEVAAAARSADIIATAELVDVRYDKYSDTMDGTMVWRVVRCHVGECIVGAQIKTRFSVPFSTSGEFCALRDGCLKRDSLRGYRGDKFLATFTRAPYLKQVAARQGTPLEGYFSLNRGYYLIREDALYHNDLHRLVDANYEDVIRLLTEE